jgi:hypothetical protein
MHGLMPLTPPSHSSAALGIGFRMPFGSMHGLKPLTPPSHSSAAFGVGCRMPLGSMHGLKPLTPPSHSSAAFGVGVRMPFGSAHGLKPLPLSQGSPVNDSMTSRTFAKTDQSPELEAISPPAVAGRARRVARRAEAQRVVRIVYSFQAGCITRTELSPSAPRSADARKPARSAGYQGNLRSLWVSEIHSMSQNQFAPERNK